MDPGRPQLPMRCSQAAVPAGQGVSAAKPALSMDWQECDTDFTITVSLFSRVLLLFSHIHNAYINFMKYVTKNITILDTINHME